jgi:hypothetical protein
MTSPRFAGIGGHHGARSKTDEWLTPPGVLDALGGWSSFDLDPCAPEVQPYPTARATFTRAENGLLQRWHGRVWLNPPYSAPSLARFLARMAGHGRGTALIFARTETDAFQRFAWGAASAVLFVAGRLNFHLPDGSRAPKNGGAPSVLIAYGRDDADVLAACAIAGSFVPLRIPRAVLGALLEGREKSVKTWREELAAWFAGRQDPVTLAEIYVAFATHPKAGTNPHWRDKLRQQLQKGPFVRVGRGLWAGGRRP